MNPIWSLALAAVGVLGIYLSGKKNYWGWGIGLGAQVLWIVYAVVTDQWGFIISALAYGWVYGKNFLTWRRDDAAAQTIPTDVGAVITFRGKMGLPWLAYLTGNGTWNVIRQGTWEGYLPREAEPEEIADEIGSRLKVLDRGLV